MAANPLKSSINGLLTQAENCADGAASVGTPPSTTSPPPSVPYIPLLQCNEANIRTDIAGLVGTQNSYQAAKAARNATTALKTTADESVRDFLTRTVVWLKSVISTQWTPAWQAVGFNGGSLELPGTVDERMALLLNVAAYFTANVAHENTTLGLATAQHTAASNARQTANNAEQAAESAAQARDAAEERLRRRLRCLIAELALLIPDNDARYHAFGLNAPDDPSTPEVPDVPVVTLGAPASHSFGLAWPHALRADRYHVYGLSQGQTVSVLLATAEDEQVTITSLASATLVAITITSVNDAGESTASPPVNVTVP